MWVMCVACLQGLQAVRSNPGLAQRQTGVTIGAVGWQMHGKSGLRQCVLHAASQNAVEETAAAQCDSADLVLLRGLNGSACQCVGQRDVE